MPTRKPLRERTELNVVPSTACFNNCIDLVNTFKETDTSNNEELIEYHITHDNQYSIESSYTEDS